MKQNLNAPIGMLDSLAFHEHLIADIAIDPIDVPPSGEMPGSQSQSWTTTAGIGVLLCAVVTMLVVRGKKSRRGKSDNGVEVSKASTETGQR